MSQNDHARDTGEVEELTVRLSDDIFSCNYCPGRTPRASFEDGEWVCYMCGMELPSNVAEAADERISDGHAEYDHTKKMAEGVAGSIPVLEEGEDAE